MTIVQYADSGIPAAIFCDHDAKAPQLRVCCGAARRPRNRPSAPSARPRWQIVACAPMSQQGLASARSHTDGAAGARQRLDVGGHMLRAAREHAPRAVIHSLRRPVGGPEHGERHIDAGGIMPAACATRASSATAAPSCAGVCKRCGGLLEADYHPSPRRMTRAGGAAAAALGKGDILKADIPRKCRQCLRPQRLEQRR